MHSYPVAGRENSPPPPKKKNLSETFAEPVQTEGSRFNS